MKLALIAMAASGCAVGAGASNVGQFRPRRVVDSTVCIQAPTGDCAQTVIIGRDLPARSFGGGVFAFGSAGYAQRRDGDAVSHGALIDGYYEYFRGRGRFALGARIGATVGVGFESRLLFSVPVTAVAHVGGGWGEVYLGAGYAPIATETVLPDDPDAMAPPATWHHDSVHALVGTRVILRTTYERSISVSPELRLQRFGGSTLASITANLGLHF